MLQRGNVLSQIYVLGFLNSFYFLHLVQFSHPNLFKIYSQKGFFSYPLGENKYKNKKNITKFWPTGFFLLYYFLPFEKTEIKHNKLI